MRVSLVKRISGTGIFILLAFAFLLVDSVRPPNFAGDVDDRLRELQLLDLLGDGKWHDLQINAIAMPEAYLTPWSRLVDAPYYAMTMAVSAFAGPEFSLMIAKIVVPLLLFWVFLIGLLLNIGLLAKTRMGIGPALLLFVAALGAIMEFAPNRIDHHNVQLVLMVWMVWGMLSERSGSGYMLGLAAALSVIVGFETLPLLFGGFLLLVLTAIYGDQRTMAKTRKAGLAIFLATPALSWLAVGKHGMLTVHCDALSLPYIVLMMIGGASMNLAPHVFRWLPEKGAVKRAAPALVLLALPSLTALAMLIYAYPVCAAGPYHMIDAVTQAFWLDRVQQEHGFLNVLATGQHFFTVLICVMMVIFLLAAWEQAFAWRERSRTAKTVVLIVVAMAGISILLTLVQVRFYRFAALHCALLVPLAYPLLNRLAAGMMSGAERLATLAMVIVPFGAAGILTATLPDRTPAVDEHIVMARDTCLDGDLSMLSSLEEGIVAAPIALSITLAMAGQENLRVAAIPTHRSSPGLRHLAELFEDQHAARRAAAAAPYAYLAVCRHDLEMKPSGASLYTHLARGGSWPGLELVGVGGNQRFALYRINHETFR